MFRRARASTVDAFLRDLTDRDFRVRVAAADHAISICDHGRPGDFDARSRIVTGLVSALSDPHPQVRGAAALALGDLRADEALAHLLVAADDDVVLVRELAIAALGEIGDPRAQERIRRALSDERAEARFQAVVAFPRVVRRSTGGVEEAWSALVVGLSDPDPHVRGRAAEACGELADGAPLSALVADALATLVNDSSEPSDVRIAAAIALAESRDPRGGNTLLSVLRGDLAEPDLGRIQAAFELAGELGLAETTALATSAAFGLRARLGDPGVRSAALTVLVRLGDRRAIDFVLAELGARSFSRRAFAIGVVARSGLAEATPKLESMRNDTTLADPQAVKDALSRIEEDDRRS